MWPPNDRNFYVFRYKIRRKKKPIVQKLHIGKAIPNYKFMIRTNPLYGEWYHSWSTWKQSLLDTTKFCQTVKDDHCNKYSMYSLISMIESTSYLKSHVDFLEQIEELKLFHPILNSLYDLYTYKQQFRKDYDGYEYRIDPNISNIYW